MHVLLVSTWTSSLAFLSFPNLWTHFFFHIEQIILLPTLFIYFRGFPYLFDRHYFFIRKEFSPFLFTHLLLTGLTFSLSVLLANRHPAILASHDLKNLTLFIVLLSPTLLYPWINWIFPIIYLFLQEINLSVSVCPALQVLGIKQWRRKTRPLPSWSFTSCLRKGTTKKILANPNSPSGQRHFSLFICTLHPALVCLPVHWK